MQRAKDDYVLLLFWKRIYKVTSDSNNIRDYQALFVKLPSPM